MAASTSNMLAVTYSDGFAADRLIAGIAYRLRDDGVKVAGLVQINTDVPGRTKCDMAVEELYTRRKFQLSEYRGPAARGCRLDHSRLSDAAGVLIDVLDQDLDLIVLNKFGKVEAEGGGLRDLIGRAVLLGVPLIVGVPYRNLDQWRHFAGGMADECEVSHAAVLRWLASKGLATNRHDRGQPAGDALRR
jgi:nucleoside-triphosphatase THEP1